MNDFLKIDYLKVGTEIQRLAYLAITNLGILENLAEYEPILVSTICNDIDIPGSDLDLIFYSTDFEKFSDSVDKLYSKMDGYKIDKNENRVLVNFFFKNFEFELYCSAVRTTEQPAYRHLLTTSKIIAVLGESFKEKVRSLKLVGIKTEPAIAEVLGLTGDPYKLLLDLSEEDILNRFY